LNVFYIKIDEITTFPCNKELAPIVGPIFGRVLVIYELFQGLHHGVMCRREKEWIREPFLLGVQYNPVLNTFISFIAPNLQNNNL